MKKKIIISLLIVLVLGTFCLSDINKKYINKSISNVKQTYSSTQTNEDLGVYLSNLNITSKCGSIQLNKNALNNELISLGNSVYSVIFTKGISILTSDSIDINYIEYRFDKNSNYTVFETDYGIDLADKNSNGARFKFYLDGKIVEEKYVTNNVFHNRFSTKITNENYSLRIEVIGKGAVCASLGNPIFYRNSTSGITKYIDNCAYSGWPVPVQKNQNLYGGSLKIGTMDFKKGLCANSTSSFTISIDGNYNVFETYVGIDESVAGGANLGSVIVKLSALDEKNNTIRSVETPILYGYMEAYKLMLDVNGATKIKVNINDANDGIANDMCVLGNPEFTYEMSSGTIYASDLIPMGYNIGKGSFVKDKTVDNNTFTFNVNGTNQSYKKGIGLYLVNAPYSQYTLDKNDESMYSYVKYNIENLKPTSFEALGINKYANAYYELWVDDICLYNSNLVQSMNNSVNSHPIRISCEIPKGSKILTIKAISDSNNDNGEIDLVNAMFLKEGLNLTNNYIKEETVISGTPYPITRNIDYLGGENVMLFGGEGRRYTNSFCSGTGLKYSFDIEKYPIDSLNCIFGLSTKNSSQKIKGKVSIEYKDKSSKEFETPEIDSQNSGYYINFYFGNNASKIVFEVISSQEAYAIWAEPILYKNVLNELEHLTDLKIADSKNGWGNIQINKSIFGSELTIVDKTFDNGFSLHAFYNKKDEAYVEFNIPSSYGYKLFECMIGVNRDTLNNGTSGSVIFKIYGDDQVIFESGLMRVSDEAKHIVVDITGISKLRLAINNGDDSYDCDCGDYINPIISKDGSLLDDYLEINSPLDGETDVIDEGKSYIINGHCFGESNIVNLFLNNEFIKSVKTDTYGFYTGDLIITKPGINEIMVEANGIKKKVSIVTSIKIENSSIYKIQTNSTFMEIEPAENGMIINSLKNENNQELLYKKSFIPFIESIRVGGVNGEEKATSFVFQKYDYEEKDLKSININSKGDEYNSKICYHTFTFIDEFLGLELKSIWYYQKDFNSPIQHKIEVKNNTGNKIMVNTADSMNLSLIMDSEAVTNNYVYKSPIYTTNYGYRNDKITSDYQMNVFSTADYNNGMQIDAGYIPWSSINYEDNNYGVYFGIVWSECRILVSGKENNIFIKSGLRENFYTEIQCDETYFIPATFVGTYIGDVDDGSNALKTWLFAFMMPECNRIDNDLPNFEYNLWEVLDTERRSWRMDDSKFYLAVDQLQQLGIDEITIDTYWWKDIGDWRGVHKKWQSTMEYSSDYTNQYGLDFSIYMQAGNGPSLNEDALTSIGVHGNPNWFARGLNETWTELCLADPDARDYLLSYLKNYYMEFKLDGMRTDFGWIIGYCDKEGHDHVDRRADVAYWTSYYMYQILDEMYREFPVPTDINNGSEVGYFKWENCNCGGTLKDFASMSYATRIQTTDAYDAVQVRRSFYDSSFCFPSMQLMLWLNDYMYNGDGPFNDQYRFYSILMGAPCPMMSLPGDMSEETYQTLKRTIEIYDYWMKDLVKYGKVYHNMNRCDGINWDGIEYYDDYTGKGAVLAFKPDPDGSVDDTYKIFFKGLKDNLNYYVWSENGKVSFNTYTGKELMENGIDLTLEGSYQAEVIYFMETTAKGALEVISKPKDLDANIEVINNDLSISVEADDITTNVNVKVKKDNEIVFDEFISTNDIVIKGLSKGTYQIVISALNSFGSKEISKIISLADDSLYFNKNKSIVENHENINVDNIYYINAYQFDLSDIIFDDNNYKEIIIKKGTNQTSLNYVVQLNKNDLEETINIELYKIDENKNETLLESKSLSYQNNTIQINHLIEEKEECFKLKLRNITKPVYYQDQLGYGRTGLYSQMISSNKYIFESDVQVLQNGLNETFPRAGVFSAYKDDNTFAAIYIDAYYGNIVLYERYNSITSDKILKYKMNNDFDYYAKHNIRIERKDSCISYYIDDCLIDQRNINIDNVKVALITEDAKARFSSVKLVIQNVCEDIKWTQYNAQVKINGKTIFSNKVTKGIWHRVKPIINILERK